MAIRFYDQLPLPWTWRRGNKGIHNQVNQKINQNHIMNKVLEVLDYKMWTILRIGISHMHQCTSYKCSVWPFNKMWQINPELPPESEFCNPSALQNKHDLPIPSSFTNLKRRGWLRVIAALILPFVQITAWKEKSKQKENRECWSFWSTQPEAMKLAWFQQHICMA